MYGLVLRCTVEGNSTAMMPALKSFSWGKNFSRNQTPKIQLCNVHDTLHIEAQQFLDAQLAAVCQRVPQVCNTCANNVQPQPWWGLAWAIYSMHQQRRPTVGKLADLSTKIVDQRLKQLSAELPTMSNLHSRWTKGSEECALGCNIGCCDKIRRNNTTSNNSDHRQAELFKHICFLYFHIFIVFIDHLSSPCAFAPPIPQRIPSLAQRDPQRALSSQLCPRWMLVPNS